MTIRCEERVEGSLERNVWDIEKDNRFIWEVLNPQIFTVSFGNQYKMTVINR